MGNMAFYAMLLVIFMQFTFGAVRFSGVNRTFLSMYRGVFESSLITVGEDGEPIYPYFSESILKAHIDDYLKENVTHYVKNYLVDINFLDMESNGVCLEDHCSKVKVTLNADINLFFTYSKSLEFKVKKGF